MARPNLNLNENRLEASKSANNKQWVAVLTDTHPEYRFEREFLLGEHTKRNRTQTTQVTEGDIVEEVWFSHGGNEKGRRYYRVDGGDLVDLDGIAEAEQLLKERSRAETLRRDIRSAVESLEEDDLRAVAEIINDGTDTSIELVADGGQQNEKSNVAEEAGDAQ